MVGQESPKANIMIFESGIKTYFLSELTSDYLLGLVSIGKQNVVFLLNTFQGEVVGLSKHTLCHTTLTSLGSQTDNNFQERTYLT